MVFDQQLAGGQEIFRLGAVEPMRLMYRSSRLRPSPSRVLRTLATLNARGGEIDALVVAAPDSTTDTSSSNGEAYTSSLRGAGFCGAQADEDLGACWGVMGEPGDGFAGAAHYNQPPS